jgi:DNA-binding XRE family transcriptional regulator
VFGDAAFREHAVMPTRKPESCPHRTRLGKNVAALRARRGLTQEQLAEKVGVSARYIQNVEAGDNFPSLPTLARLRAVLRCDWNELFTGCDKV